VSCLLRTRALSLQIADTQVCNDMQLCIEPGQSWALLGRNGIGKTTLLHHLAGLRANAGGQVFLGANDISGLQPRERARQVAVLLQHSNRGFGASVLETVLSGRHPHLERLAWEDSDDLAIAEGCIAACGLATLSSRSLDTLSGGELRRVEIARLLTQQCPLALLDEPLNHLDFGHQAAMLRLLGEHCVSAGRAMLMVIHDLNAAYRACNHWLILSGAGRWHAGPRDALADPALLTAAFGHPVQRIETDDGPLFQPHL
jgi:iron complex transport system ATP-binding protein